MSGSPEARFETKFDERSGGMGGWRVPIVEPTYPKPPGWQPKVIISGIPGIGYIVEEPLPIENPLPADTKTPADSAPESPDAPPA